MKIVNITAKEILLLITSTLTVLAGATIAPSLPYIAANFAKLEHSTFWAQLALSLPGISVAVAAAWIGKHCTPNNTHRILMVALLGYGAFGTLYLLEPNYLILLLFSRAALGFCVAAIMIATTLLLVKNTVPQQRGRLLGYQAAAGGFGGVIYMAIANQLTQWYELAPFGLYAIAWLLAALFLFIFSATKEQHPTVKPQQKPSIGTAPKTLSMGTFLFFAALAAIEIVALYSLILQAPILEISSTYNMSAALTLAILCMSITAACYSFFQTYLSLELQHIIGMLVLSLGFLILGVPGETIDLSTLVVAFCIIGVGLGLLRPNVFAWLFSLIALEQRQNAVGKLTAVIFGTQFFAPLIIYPITHLFNVSTMWITLAITTTLSAVMIYVINNQSTTINPEKKPAATSI